MAAAALRKPAPSERCVPWSGAAALLAAGAAAMHVARPKSAKGRTRSSAAHPPRVAAAPLPSPHTAREPAHDQKAPRPKPAFPSGQGPPGAIPEFLQQVPLRTSSSLNKYRVLPSIHRRDGGNSAVEMVTKQTVRLRMSKGLEEVEEPQPPSREQGSADTWSEAEEPPEEGLHSQCPETRGRKMGQESSSLSTVNVEETPKKEPSLLLAIRSPSGQRFEHHFKSTDSLQTILAVAEQKTAAKYDQCSVLTMEVPRRSFSDLTRSLRECGILHRSVLCILQGEQPEGNEDCRPCAPP